MGKRKLEKIEANEKLSWVDWLIDRKETLSFTDERNQKSNFIPYTRESHGFAGMPGAYSPGVLWKKAKQPPKLRKSD
ncbi:MAG: hypothetical protein ACFE9D_09155 [Promethearchaeota archaeon]